MVLMQMSRKILMLVAILALAALPLLGQSTGKLTGTVSHSGAGLPGVTVTVSSPALQGTRSTVTDVNGNYNFGVLPPGPYTVRFEMESMQTVTRDTTVALAGTARADAEMRLTSVAESITVTAAAPAVLETTEVQTNVEAQLVQELPINRTLLGAAALAPGINTNGPNPGAVTISGALAADNLFLVNGAVINENLRGQPHNLFIEDAIQETTVMTAGISAEYGRFAGGVVSAVTKSGGNEFSGSFRDTFTNPAWTEESLEGQAEPLDEITEIYEATLGGRIIRDRLWFFSSGRFFEQETQGFFATSNTPYTNGQEETRYEVKLTGALTAKHNLVGSYLNVQTDQTNYCFPFVGNCFEATTIDPGRSLPNDFLTANYSGIITNNFLLEGNYAEKHFTFEGSGGDDPDRIRGTWGYDYGSTGAFFGAPVFCGFCDPEERNNTVYGVKTTYYLATKAAGTHNIVTGYENWAEERISNNYQSASNYGVYVYTQPTFNAAGVLTPTITRNDLIGYYPIFELTQGSDFQTDSIFINDKWDLNQHWSFNLGARYDQNDGVDSSGNAVADDSAISPRLGLIYDPFGNGRFRVNASFSRYVNRVAETIGGGGSRAGTPAVLLWLYTGPTITGLPTFDAFAEMFEWFDALCDEDDPTACGINSTDNLVVANVAGVNTQIQGSLKSPTVDEISLGVGAQVGQNGFIRADYINRDWADFFITRTDLTTGTVIDPFGNTLDRGFIENTDDYERTYDAVQLQGGYRWRARWNFGGNYTWSQTRGNQTGQTAGNGPIPDNATGPFAYPELKAYAQFNPSGYLPQDQRHKLRAWLSYDLATFIGNFNFSLLQNYDSALPYSLIGAIDVRPYVDQDILDQYNTAPSGVNYYFSGRGSERWDDTTSTDLGINYALPLGRVQLFIQGDVLNVFDEVGQINGNTQVLTAKDDPDTLQPFNPFTETPVEGVHWRRGPNFGQATTPAVGFDAFGAPIGNAHTQLPRTYRFSAGVRF
jgi:hypothetical protein